MSDEHMGLVLRFHIDDERRNEFRQHAEMVLRKARPRGCIGRGLIVKTGKPDIFLWVERWESAARLVPHLASDEHRAFVGSIRVLGELEAERVIPLETPSWSRLA